MQTLSYPSVQVRGVHIQLSVKVDLTYAMMLIMLFHERQNYQQQKDKEERHSSHLIQQIFLQHRNE